MQAATNVLPALSNLIVRLPNVWTEHERLCGYNGTVSEELFVLAEGKADIPELSKCLYGVRGARVDIPKNGCIKTRKLRYRALLSQLCTPLR